MNPPSASAAFTQKDEWIVTPTRWVQQGYTLAHHPETGQPIFVHGAVPGERVRIRISRSRQQHAFGVVTEVLAREDRAQTKPTDRTVHSHQQNSGRQSDYSQKSGHINATDSAVAREYKRKRRAGACPVFPQCGGCSFQHIDYLHELAIKMRLLREWKHLNVCREQTRTRLHTARPGAYRNQARFRIRNGAAGFSGLHSNELVPFPEQGCELLSAEMRAAIARLQSDTDVTALESGEWHLRQTDSIVHVHHRRSKSEKPKKSRRPRPKGSAEESRTSPAENWLKQEIKISGCPVRSVVFPIEGFFQSNRFLLERWLERLTQLAWLDHGRPDLSPEVSELRTAATAGGSGRQILELFSGSGIIGTMVAGPDDAYSGYESDNAALGAARENWRQHSARNVRLYRRDLYRQPVSPDADTDLLIANPPRAGIGHRQIQAIINVGTPRILYSSCNPHTLNRDLGWLLAAGYHAAAFEVFDFFPRTPHLEIVALLIRRP
ncbi:MAG: class I SAM-dependent RNA methyltransferase [Leptospiraceae bacterium]|nr:class I SAM-dependent RNA methyltransferase [Leptospiraceae bacterium]